MVRYPYVSRLCGLTQKVAGGFGRIGQRLRAVVADGVVNAEVAEPLRSWPYGRGGPSEDGAFWLAFLRKVR